MNKKAQKEAERPVFEVLKSIKEGVLDPGLLSKEARESCVEALVVEGYGSGQIASLLKKSDRTVRRDLVEIRKKNALSSSTELAGIIAGELLMAARNQSGRLKQIARSNDVSLKDKANIEYMSWLVFKEAADKLHKIGFLPVTVDRASSYKEKMGEKKDKTGELDPGILRDIRRLNPIEQETLRLDLEKRIVEAEIVPDRDSLEG